MKSYRVTMAAASALILSAVVLVLAGAVQRNRDPIVEMPITGGRTSLPQFSGVYSEWGYDIAPTDDAEWYRWRCDYSDAYNYTVQLLDASAGAAAGISVTFQSLMKPQAISQTVQFTNDQYVRKAADGTILVSKAITDAYLVSEWLAPGYVDRFLSEPGVIDGPSEDSGIREAVITISDQCSSAAMQAFEDDHPGLLGACNGGVRTITRRIHYREADEITTKSEFMIDAVPIRRIEWDWLEVSN